MFSYYNARYYNPALGRFVSADSIVPNPSDPQALNRYSYVLNNPLIYTDPTGHSWLSKIGKKISNFFKKLDVAVEINVSASYSTPYESGYGGGGGGSAPQTQTEQRASACSGGSCVGSATTSSGSYNSYSESNNTYNEADANSQRGWVLVADNSGKIGAHDNGWATFDNNGVITSEVPLQSNFFDEPILFFFGGGLRNVAKGTTTLYRAVTEAELKQIRKTGIFEAGPNSLGGKWFAENAKHARRWGDAMNGPGNSTILRVDLSKSQADQFMRMERLDGIGPARYGELDQLRGAIIRELRR